MVKAKNSTRPESALVGLRKHSQERKTKSLEIVHQAIIALRQAGTPITLGSISDATKKFTANGQSVAQSTILRNHACRDLYLKEAQPIRKKNRLKKTLLGALDRGPSDSEVRRMSYLMRSTKEELVAKLIEAERTIKSSNDANALLRTTILKQSLE